MSFTRRKFLQVAIGAFPATALAKGKEIIMTVDGAIAKHKLGKTLIHEHFLVDFIGAEKYDPSRWDRFKVAAKVLPYLEDVKKFGVRTILDCTPSFLGKDPGLLKILSNKSGIRIVTNTGYYGAVQNKYLPDWVYDETTAQLSLRWINEFRNGIEGTYVKPGFIKISVDPAPLSEVHKKIVSAAAQTHLVTGLTICSHTGLAPAAFEQLGILESLGIHPSAFVWVHAQAEKDKAKFLEAGKRGAWVSLDGIGWGNFEDYADSIQVMKDNQLLHRVLISHDAGWYKPDEPDGEFKGYTNIFTELIPRLEARGFGPTDINQLLIANPANAFSIGVRKL